MRPSRLLLSLLLFLPAVAPAATLRVPEDRKTIQAGIDAAKNGDTVLVAPGTYRENLLLQGKNITLASTFLLERDPSRIAATVIEGKTGTNRGGGVLLRIEKTDVTDTRIIGLTFLHGDHGIALYGKAQILDNRFIENGDGFSFESGAGVLRNNVFEKNRDDGIDMDDASEATIEDNAIRDNGDDGIEIRLHKYNGPTLNIVIRRNVITGNKEDGIQLIDYPGKSDRSIRIERNLLAKNAMVAIATMKDGDTRENYAGADMLETVLVVNNTITGHPHGVTGGDNMVLVNNVVFENAKSAFKRVHGDSVATHNLLWRNGSDFEDCDLNRDVIFARDPGLDEAYRPKANSPCIDAGAKVFEYHGARQVLPPYSYNGTAPDLGAFESVK